MNLWYGTKCLVKCPTYILLLHGSKLCSLFYFIGRKFFPLVLMHNKKLVCLRDLRLILKMQHSTLCHLIFLKGFMLSTLLTTKRCSHWKKNRSVSRFFGKTSSNEYVSNELFMLAHSLFIIIEYVYFKI